jgi:beta-N-acetylhexosaminidase
MDRETLRRKLGQLFLVGFQGYELPSEVCELINGWNLGGVILFRRNIAALEQTRELCRELQLEALKSSRDYPLLIGIDQEWGLVNRFPAEILPPIPGAMALGAMGGKALNMADRLGVFTGRLLRSLGINLNFAPVADLSGHPRNPQLKTRAFHQQPFATALLAESFAEGLYSQGVFPCPKHFPGLGEAAVDTHLGTAVVDRYIEALWGHELIPFRRFVKSHYDFLMVSHARFPALCADNLPASLSPSVIDGLLRSTMGYEQVVCTDDLEMGAIAGSYLLEEACLHALQAGADLLLVCQSPCLIPGIIEYLEARIREGLLSADRIDASYERLMEAKATLANLPLTAEVSALGELRRQAVMLAQDIGAGALAAHAGTSDESLLCPGQAESVLVLVPGRVFRPGSAEDFECCSLTGRLSELVPSLTVAAYPADPGEQERADLKRLVAKAGRLVLVTCDTLYYEGELALLRELAAASEEYGVVSVGAPFELSEFPDARQALATFTTLEAALRPAAEALVGTYTPPGTLPVALTASYCEVASEDSSRASASASEGEDRVRNSPKTQILLVEDSLVGRRCITLYLERLGYTVETVVNGREALEALKARRYEMVLMDVVMPEMDGLEATREIRRSGSDVLDRAVPVVALTAADSTEERRQCLEAGMNDVLRKPASPEALQVVVERWRQTVA